MAGLCAGMRIAFPFARFLAGGMHGERRASWSPPASLDKYSSRYAEWKLAGGLWRPAPPRPTGPSPGRHIWSRLFKPELLRGHVI